MTNHVHLMKIKASKLSNYATKNLAFNDREMHALNTANVDIITK